MLERWILFWILLVFCVFLIGNFMYDKLFRISSSSASSSPSVEGMTMSSQPNNTTFRLYKKIGDPNQSMEYRLTELTNETLAAYSFCIIDANALNKDNPVVVAKEKEKAEEEAKAKANEKRDPSGNMIASSSSSYTEDDPTTTSTNAAAVTGEGTPTYQRSPTEMMIQKNYQTFADQFPTFFEKKYGHLFQSSRLAADYGNQRINQPSEKLKLELSSILKTENQVMYFVLTQGGVVTEVDVTSLPGRVSSEPWTDYFANLIHMNRSNQEALDKIKRAFLAIFQPGFLTSLLSQDYVANANVYRKEDGGSMDSIWFYLHTCREIVSTLPDVMTHKDLQFNVETGKLFILEDKPGASSSSHFLNANAVAVYQRAFSAYELWTAVNATKYITTPGRFVAGFPAYLEKKTGQKDSSVFLFLMS